MSRHRSTADQETGHFDVLVIQESSDHLHTLFKTCPVVSHMLIPDPGEAGADRKDQLMHTITARTVQVKGNQQPTYLRGIHRSVYLARYERHSATPELVSQGRPLAEAA